MTGKIVLDGLEYDIFVVPNLPDNFKEYCNHYRTSQVCDQVAYAYSSNDKFQLMVLHSDAASI